METLQAIMDDIRLGHESNEDLIARMLIPDHTEELPCVWPTITTNEFPAPLQHPTITANEFPFLEDIPIPLQRPVLVRTITTNEFPELPLDIPIYPLQRNEYRLPPSQLERNADSEEKATLATPVFSVPAEEVVQDFRKA